MMMIDFILIYVWILKKVTYLSLWTLSQANTFYKNKQTSFKLQAYKQNNLLLG